jgi:hypothetical protein
MAKLLERSFKNLTPAKIKRSRKRPANESSSLKIFLAQSDNINLNNFSAKPESSRRNGAGCFIW